MKNRMLLPLVSALLFGSMANAVTVVSLNQDGVFVLNGRKVFPILMSPGPPPNSVTPTGKDALQEFYDAGALFVRMSQSVNWSDPSLVPLQQATLDWAAQHGMYVMVNLRELSYFAAGDTTKPPALTNLVLMFKDHPALGLWKNQDEAWWGNVSAADLQRGYDVIKALDPNHPVEQTHAPRGTVADLQPYNAAADIIALDIYPVGYPPGQNSLLANKEISMVGDYTDFLAQVANGQRAYWMIEQIAWSGVQPPTKTLRFPTFPQSRFMAYQAIIHGARGLMFFGGNVAFAFSEQDAPLGWNWTFWDQVLKRMVLELGDKGLLRDALVAPASTLPIQVNGLTNVEFCVREVPPNLYILACMREGNTTNVTFSGLPSTAKLGNLLYESPRTVTAQNGQFTDWFGPFEVHAYRFALTNFVASEWPLYEPFTYTNIAGPVSSNSPEKWTYGGSGANDLSVVSGSLSYTGLAASVGNSVTNGGAGLGVRRLFTTNMSSGVVYFSALFRINGLGYGAWDGKSTIVGAFSAPDNTSFRTQVLVKSNTPSTYVFGVQKGGGTGAVATFGTTPFYAGDTVFLVGKYDFTASPNAAVLWIDPQPATLGGGNEPASGYLFVNSGSDGYTIDRFNMRQNTVSSVPAAMQWDELRVGPDWASVTPAGAGSRTILSGSSFLPSGAFQFGYSAGTDQVGSIVASTNLMDWSRIGWATQLFPGYFQFTDPAASNYNRRFYRLLPP